MGSSERWGSFASVIVGCAVLAVSAYIVIVGLGFHVSLGQTAGADFASPTEASPPETDRPAQPETIESVIATNAKARERFHAYTLEQEWTGEDAYRYHPGQPSFMPKEDVTTHGTMRITRRGDHFLVTRTSHAESASGAWSQSNSMQGVVNDRYGAEYRMLPEPEISLFEHESPEKLDRQVNGLDKPCALDYVFGADSTLVNHFKNQSDVDEWAIDQVELDNASVHRLTVVSPAPENREWTTHYYVDPNRDYLLRGYDWYVLDGSLGRTCRVELAYSETGKLWYPKRVKYENMYESHFELELAVTYFECNPAIADDLFEIESFGTPSEGARLRRIPVGRDRILNYRYSGGKWVSGRTKFVKTERESE